jgi:hypothetical protein
MSVITGMGDYEVKENSIVQRLGSGGTGQVPQFLSAGGCSRMSHREFLGLVTSPGPAFTITGFPINPFNSVTFPWLSEIAGSFETFKLRGMVVEFVSTYGDAVSSTNASLGSVILATQYNTTAPPFASQIQMENYQFATSTKPSVSMIHPIECDPSQLPLEHLYVFPSTAISSNDPRWTTLGTTYLATVGQQAAATLGELWMTYDIEFYQPKLLASVSNSGLGAHYFYNGSLAASYSNATPLPPAMFLTPTLRTGDLLLTGVPGFTSFSLPPGLNGTFMFSYSVNCPLGPATVAPQNTGNFTVTNGSSVLMVSSASGTSPPNPQTGVTLSAGFTSGGTSGYWLMVGWFSASPSAPNLACTVNIAVSPGSGFTGSPTGNVGIDLVVTAIGFNG